jgi:hypothetical protein
MRFHVAIFYTIQPFKVRDLNVPYTHAQQSAYACLCVTRMLSQRMLSLPTDMLGACSASLDKKMENWKFLC